MTRVPNLNEIVSFVRYLSKMQTKTVCTSAEGPCFWVNTTDVNPYTNWTDANCTSGGGGPSGGGDEGGGGEGCKGGPKNVDYVGR